MIDLIIRLPMWFLHGAAPPYFWHNFGDYLNEVQVVPCIRREKPVVWPPRSPDLNPFDIFCGDI